MHGLRNARKHIGWYLATSGRPAAAVKDWRRRLCTSENARDVLAGLATFYAASAGGRMNAEPARERVNPSPRRHIEHDLLLSALPHPILVLGDDDRVLYANAAAESFFSLSQGVLKRQTLPDIIAFSSPLSALVGQVRRTGATVNEYGIDVGLPRSGVQKLVDVFAGAMPDHPGLIVLMLQQRSMAQMIERQLTHRAAARSVSGTGGRAGARDQEPAFGHPRRRAAAGARPQGRRPGADAAHLHGDRPHPQSGRPHGGVRRRAAASATEPVNIHSGARSREAAGADRLCRRHQVSPSSSTRRCRRWPATATS